MILNIYDVKTEALLIFCRDLIASYKDNNDNELFNIDNDTILYIQKTTYEINEEIEKIIQPTQYYIQNAKNFGIKEVIKYYNFINAQLNKKLKQNSTFNPTMIYMSLLATWFAEVGYVEKNKKYLYFSLYPFCEVYDKLLLKIKDTNYKALNISMIDIAEDIIYKLK